MNQETRDKLYIAALLGVILVAAISFYLFFPRLYATWGVVEVAGPNTAVVNTSVMGDNNSYVFYFPDKVPEVGSNVTIDYKPTPVKVVKENRWTGYSFNYTGVYYVNTWQEGYHEWHVIGLKYCSPGQCE